MRRRAQHQKPSSTRKLNQQTSYSATLTLHDHQRLNDPLDVDLLLNPKHFTNVQIGDIIWIYAEQGHGQDEDRGKRLYMQVNVLEAMKGSVQISLGKHIAERFGLISRTNVIVQVVKPEEAQLDFIELSFKDQYISRGDMWRFRGDLRGKCVYIQQNVLANGLQAQVNQLLVNGQHVSSGVITKDTKWIFRSRSAKLTWLIQLSEEMWDCADDGELYHEKVVNGLVKVILDQWQVFGTNHCLSVILFARTIYHKSASPSRRTPSPSKKRTGNIRSKYIAHSLQSDEHVFQTDHQNRLYQDFYKVIIDNQEIKKDSKGKEWESLRVKLKEEINLFAARVKWGEVDEATGLRGLPSTAAEGNVLEAMNLAINVFDKHYIDRDLKRTGLGVVVFTAGNGVLIVDQNLASLTKQRMADNGVGCDIISVARPPIHEAPLFIYKSKLTSSFPSRLEINENTPTFEVPLDWLLMKYYDYQYAIQSTALGTPFSRKLKDMRSMEHPFVPLSCSRIFSDEESFRECLQNESNPVLYKVPYDCFLESVVQDLDESKINFEEYDEAVFKTETQVQANVSPLVNEKIGQDREEVSRSLSSSPNLSNIRFRLGIVPTHSESFASLQNIENSKRMVSFASQPKKSEKISGSLNQPSSLPKGAIFLHADNPLKRAAHRRYLNVSNLDTNKGLELPAVHSFEFDTPLIAAASEAPFSPFAENAVKRFQKTLQVDNIREAQLVVESTLMEQDASFPSDDTTEACGFINPFKHQIRPLNAASSRRRWSHLLPNFDSEGLEELNMKSLSIPAILPLTCDYFPSQSERSKHFLNYFYTLSLYGESNGSSDLLEELIMQRLSQDFQLALSSIKYSSPNLSLLPEPQVLRYHLSMADECHIVEYDLTSGNAEVQRYVRRGRTKRGKHEQLSVPYRYFLWNDYVHRFYPLDIIIASNNYDYNWNYVDQLICGFYDSFLPNLKHRRKRFALIPSKGARDTADSDFIAFLETITEKKFQDLKITILRTSQWFDGSYNFEGRSNRSISVDQMANHDGDDFVSHAIDSNAKRQGFGLLGVHTSCSRINLKSARIDRKEWLNLQYDAFYSSDSAFHFEVHWLVASGTSVDQFLQEVVRKGKSFGMSIAEIPADQALRTSDPFHVGIKIPILPKFLPIVRDALLLDFGFVYDGAECGSVRQFIHRSGMSLLRELSDGVLWISNTLPCSEHTHRSCKELFRQICEFCHTLSPPK